MDKIAKTLKERREELGLSVEDINEKTKLPVQHILALEKGDISYFKEDLSYLQFFVRSYCNALDLDFAEIKGDVFDSVDSFTQAFEEKEVVRRKSMEEEILKSSLKLKRDKIDLEDEDTNRGNKKTVKPISRRKIELAGSTKRVRRIEPSVVILIILLIGVITVLGIKVLNPSVGNETPSEETSEIKPLDPKEETEEKPEEKPEVPPFVVTRDDTLTASGEIQLQISGYKIGDVVNISTIVPENCWMDFYLNNQEYNKLDWKVYSPEETVAFDITLENNRETFKLGYGNNLGAKTISLNGKDVEIGEQVAGATRYITLVFVQGEE